MEATLGSTRCHSSSGEPMASAAVFPQLPKKKRGKEGAVGAMTFSSTVVNADRLGSARLPASTRSGENMATPNRSASCLLPISSGVWATVMRGASSGNDPQPP
jgi:hypothetical protein